MTEWRPIPFATAYEVSDDGHVRRVGRAPGAIIGTILKPWFHKGYPVVGLQINGKSKKRTVHRLVCWAFHGPPPTSRHHAAHRDGKRDNPAAENVRWVTPSENEADKLIHGTRLHSKPTYAKLSIEDVHIIRCTPKTFGSGSDLARRFNVGQAMISHIRNPSRRHWPTVPFP